MNDSPTSWFQQVIAYRCSDCGCKVGFQSRARTIFERYLLPLCLMQPVRCSECFHRDYRLFCSPVRESPAAIAHKNRQTLRNRAA
jgi:hypothetical protein